MITVDHVTKSIEGHAVLEDINLRLATQKTHVLLGLSGSGKSTLLRLMIGLTSAERGEIFFDSEPMKAETQRRLSQKIGYIPQGGGLFPHLTIEKNVTLVARTLGWTAHEIDQRLKDLLQIAALEADLLRRYPSEISGGQQQRISVIRACFLRPRYLLADEPLGALDPIVRASLQKELKHIFNQMKCTVVFVTHDIREAAYFGHTVTLLQNGRVLQHGSFEDLQERPLDPFVTQFIQAQEACDH